MDDLISRQAAIDALLGITAMRNTIPLDSAIFNIKKLPSAQPERKKGEWIRNDNGTYSCSVCQSWIPKEQHNYARYCLYCGADMRGEQDG